jgi:DNA polymerase-3 subunit delta
VLDRLTQAGWPDAAARGPSREVLYADQATPEEVVGAGLGLPLFGSRRLVVVRGVAGAPARAIDRLRSAIVQARAGLVAWPEAGVTVVLVASGTDRKGAGIRLLPETHTVEVRPPTGRALVGWLQDRARAGGLELAPEAATALVERIGEGPGRLAGEIEKLALHAGDDRRVSGETVRTLVGESREQPYWELTQALEAANRGDALRLLSTRLAAGDEPLVLLAWMVGYARNLWRVLAALADGADPRGVGRMLRPPRPDWVAERLVARATGLGMAGVALAIRRGLWTERALKSGAGSARALLTGLVTDLAR